MSSPRRLCRVVLAMLALAAPSTSVAAQQRRDTMVVIAPAGALSFLSLGDWGRNGEFHQRDVARQMASVATKLDAEFVLALGDNFYPNGVQSVQDPQWAASFEQVYTAHSLNIDWFAVLGNHDYHGNPRAEVDYSSISRRWRMTAPYYAVRKEVAKGVTADFFMIDSSPFIKEYWSQPEKYAVTSSDTAGQRRWLDSALAASTAQWKFIVGHHNVYSGGKRPVLPDMEALLVSRMGKYHVTAYLAGHEHQLEEIVPEGSSTHYIISGAGSETRDAVGMKGTRFVSNRSGFWAFSLTADAVVLQAIDYTGKLLYRGKIAR